ncbi:hypothetical protein HYR99_00055 [Candidatus Poribacteria bacterium]|nr:hypothetical protein [Candidatus Poribacteria bacterium]
MAWVSWISFIGLGVLLVLALTLSWQYFTGDSFVKSLYWSVQTFTTVGYGTGFDDWGRKEYILCIISMLTSTIYWGCVVAVIGTGVVERLRSR